MHADKHKTYLCAHIHWQGLEVHTRSEGIMGVGLAVAVLEHMVPHVYTNKKLHKLLTNIQQTVSILTIEHVYRYGTLLLGVCVCLGGVRIDT